MYNKTFFPLKELKTPKMTHPTVYTAAIHRRKAVFWNDSK